MRKGRRHAGLGVLLGLGWGGLTTFAIWSSDGVEAQESAEAAFIWSWPFHESEAAQIVATLHTILVALFVVFLKVMKVEAKPSLTLLKRKPRKHDEILAEIMQYGPYAHAPLKKAGRCRVAASRALRER